MRPTPDIKSFRRFGGEVAAVPPGRALSKVGQSLRNRYDAEVRFTDQQVARLLEFVDKQPWGKNTAVVVSADHGEAFGEHKSYYEHGYYLFEVAVRVPLMFWVPGLSPRIIERRRSHVDLAKTLLQLLRVKPNPQMRGKSLLREMTGQLEDDRPIIVDLPYTDQTPRRRALIVQDMKLIVSETEPVPLLFDLGRDPAEQRDLASSRKRQVQRLREQLSAFERRVPDYPAPRRSRRAY